MLTGTKMPAYSTCWPVPPLCHLPNSQLYSPSIQVPPGLLPPSHSPSVLTLAKCPTWCLTWCLFPVALGCMFPYPPLHHNILGGTCEAVTLPWGSLWPMSQWQVKLGSCYSVSLIMWICFVLILGFEGKLVGLSIISIQDLVIGCVTQEKYHLKVWCCMKCRK